MEDEVILALDRKRAKQMREASEVVCLADLDEKPEYFQTGIPEIDYRVGGIPRKCILQLGAAEGVGKTTLALQMVVGALSFMPKEYKAGLMDYECRMNVPLIKYLCRTYNVDENRILFKRPISGQDGIKTQLEWLDDPCIAIQVMDSIKAVVDEKNIERDIDKSAAMMANAKLVNEFLEKIIARVRHLDKSIIAIDHLKKVAVPGMSYQKWETVSGAAIKFFASARWFLKRVKTITGTRNKMLVERGSKVKIKIQKTTVSEMCTLDDIDIYYARGVSSYSWYLKKAIEYGLMTKKGNTFSIVKKDKTAEVVATSIRSLRSAITEPNNKWWPKIVCSIRKAEDKKFMHAMEQDPEIYESEFKI